jgi:hypothetical protein
MTATITWKKTKAGATGEASTKHCTYRWVIEPSEIGFQRFTMGVVITNTVTGETIYYGRSGSASTVAACKRMAAEEIGTGGPRLDARIEGGE